MKDKGSLYVGLLLVILGVIFIAAQWSSVILRPFGLALGWRMMWPFLILFVGLAFWLPIFIWWERRQKLAGLAIPGTIIVANGLLLLYQNSTGNWGSWSYMWTLEPIAVGMGLLFLYLLANRPQGLLLAAAIVGGTGLVFFAIFGSIFGGVLRLLAPVVLIALGVLIILGGLGRRPGHHLPAE